MSGAIDQQESSRDPSRDSLRSSKLANLSDDLLTSSLPRSVRRLLSRVGFCTILVDSIEHRDRVQFFVQIF